jgi:Asp/Glu/hydantoin racemase
MSTPITIGVTHTSPAAVELFGRLLKERLPGVRVINVLDDTILPQLLENGGDLAAIEPRWRSYVRVLSEQGAGLILNACSSIGELCGAAQAEFDLPVVRVDAGMAREAVRWGDQVAIIATLKTTLRPTGDLLRETAALEGRPVKLDETLVEGAYVALMRGDQQRHDDLILATLEKAADRSDAVILAQASMARVIPRLSTSQGRKVLASPSFAVEDLARFVASASQFDEQQTPTNCDLTSPSEV